MLSALFFAMVAQGAEPTGELSWNKQTQRFDANIQNWPLQQVLEHIAGITGWEVQCPEGITRNVTVKFKNLPENEALDRFLGNLSYATLPTTNGVKLCIYDSTGATGIKIAPKVAESAPTVATPKGTNSTSAARSSTKGPYSRFKGATPNDQNGDPNTTPAEGEARKSDSRSKAASPFLLDRYKSGNSSGNSRFGPSRGTQSQPAPVTPAPAPAPVPVPQQ